MFYTDGSCDEATSPYVARAAWAVVLRQADQNDPTIQTVRITASGHCPGLQTINRAELYAFVIAAKQAIYAQPQVTRYGRHMYRFPVRHEHCRVY